jgi:hypothetical protein
VAVGLVAPAQRGGQAADAVQESKGNVTWKETKVEREVDKRSYFCLY